MINTIKKILDFDISDNKKLELIRTLVKEDIYYSGTGGYQIGNAIGGKSVPLGVCTKTDVQESYGLAKQ